MTDSIRKLLRFIQSNPSYSTQNSERRMRRLGYDAIYEVRQDTTIAVDNVLKHLGKQGSFVALIDDEDGQVWELKEGEYYAIDGLGGDMSHSESMDYIGPWFRPEELKDLETRGVISCLLGGWEKYLEKEDQS